MKKTRWLAGLLCVMMIMTVIPVVAVASEVTYDTIEEITGYDLLTVKTYDFTAENAESLYTGSGSGCDSNEVTFDTTDGMTLAGAAPRWRFGSANSSSLGADRVIYFRAKVTEGNNAMVYFHVPDSTADSDAYEVSIKPEGVSAGAYSTGTQMTAFVPGTGYVEYLAIDKEDGNGLFLYAKSGDQYDGKWVCVLNETVPNGSLSSSSKVYFTGSCSVQEVVLYQEYATYDTMEEIVGHDLLIRKSYDFTAENAESMYTGSSSGCDSNEVSFDTTNGMTLSGAAPRWRIGSANSSSLGENKAVYFRLKADAEKETNVHLHVPDTTADQDAYGISISSSAVKAASYTTGSQVMDFVPGTGFVDYLAMDRQDGKGLLLYARNDDQYGGKWVCVLNETVPNGSLSASSEVYFTTAGSVQEVVLYGAAETFDDMKTIVGAEVYPYKSFHFSAANAESLYSGFDSLDDTYDTANGLTLADTNLEDAYIPRWRWSKEDSWSAIADGRAIYFKAKVPTNSDTLTCYFKSPNDETEKKEEAYVLKITAADVIPQGAATIGTSFAPGTDWAEYLVMQGENGMGLYAKQEGFLNGKWFHICNIAATSAISKNSAVYFSGVASVQDAVIYTRNAEEEELPPIDPGAEIYDSIPEIIGKDVIPYKSFDMSNKNYQSQAGFVFKPSGEHTPENGAPIDSTLEGGKGFWRYNAGTENWSPLTPGTRGAYFQLKVEEGKSMELRLQNPNGNNEYGSFTISPTAFGENLFTTLEYARDGGAGTGFVEYFVAAEENGRVKLYAKNLAGDGKWVLAAVANGYASKDNANIGLYFAGDGFLKMVDLYGVVESYDDVKTIVGAEVYPYKSFRFSATNAEGMYSGYDSQDATYDTTNGLTLADTNLEDAYIPRWRYSQESSWSAIADGRALYFKAKVPSNEEILTCYFKSPVDETEKREQAYEVTIGANGLTVYGSAETFASFAPGTDWAEYLVVYNTDGIDLYAKQEGFLNGKWFKLLHATSTYGVSANSAVYFTKAGSVQEAVIYTLNAEEEELPPIDPGVEIYDSIDGIMGKTVIPYKAFDMTNKNYQSQPGFVFKPSGTHTPENGAPLESALEGGLGFWRFYNGVENWSPLTPGTRGAYFQLKVEEGKSVEVKVQNPNGNNEYGSFTISPTAFGENNFVALDYNRAGGAGTGFVEYFLIAEENGRVKLFGKNLAGDGKWVLAAVASGYANKDNASIGLYFAGDGYLKSVKLYDELDESLLYENMEDIAGEGLFPYKNFNFTSASAPDNLPIGKYDQAEVTFGTEDGMVLKDVIDEENDPENAIGPRWRFADSDAWSAIDNGRVVYFKAKVPENQTMVSYFKMPNDTTEKQEQVYVLNIAPTGIFSDATAEMKLPFAPGTDWAEYLILKTDTGMAVYARQDGFVGGKWVYALHVTATSGISKHSAVYFTRCGSIQKLTIYDTNMVFTTKDSLADITGPAYAAQNFVFRPGFDVLLNGGTFPQGEAPVIDENGMKLEEGKNWRFYQNGDGWSPLDHGDTAVFRAKVSDSDDILEVLMKSPLDNQNKAYIIIRETGVVINNNADVDMKFNFVPGTDWVEYLVQGNDNGGYDVWVKATLFGNDKWYLLAETTAYNDESGSKATGFRFRCNATCNAYIDYAKVYADDDMVEEAVTKPTAELMSYFEEEFNSSAIIENGVVNSMAVENGVLAVTEGAASGDYTIVGGGILKGGYAEFRTAGTGVNSLVFCDGTDCLQLSFNGPAAVVGMEETEQGTKTIDITDGGNIYRTWRIVRNNDGTYNGYTKMEEEGIWVKAFENQAPVPVSDTPAQVAILAGNSEVKYDYIRIYGPAPEKELTLQDGFGIAELQVTDGVGTIAYPSAFRAIVREGDAEKTLIIAEVKDGLLTNMVSEEVEVGSDVIPVTYSMKDKTATLKVFLWDGIGSMNHLNEGARLTVAK